MPAPKKADSDKIKQVKVHVKVSDLEKYDRHKIEQLIEADKSGAMSASITKEGYIKMSGPTKIPVDSKRGERTELQERIADIAIDRYNKSKNVVNFMAKLKSL